MRYVHPAAQAAREQRAGLVEYPMVWVTATNRQTGVPEGGGFWTGGDTEEITVVDMFSGVQLTRFFVGAGGLLEISAVRHAAGLNIRPVTISLSRISEAAKQLIYGYEPRGAEVQIWRRCLDPATRQELGVERVFKGYINKAPATRPTPGGESTIEVQCVSTPRMLTIASTRKKSHEAQRQRQGDAFRRYAASAGTVELNWGQKDGRK